MTYTLLCFVQKAQHLSAEEFKNHYENVHVPLVKSLVKNPEDLPLQYKRHYFSAGETQKRYSALTTLEFRNEQAAQRFHTVLSQPGAKEKIDADSAAFCDMNQGAVIPVEVSDRFW